MQWLCKSDDRYVMPYRLKHCKVVLDRVPAALKLPSKTTQRCINVLPNTESTVTILISFHCHLHISMSNDKKQGE